ncbi:MAG: oxalate/formate MFS antiporter [Pseudomonadota bacterium]|nr:oxalate/formate MFS antiporter [Pseudomonadota bacterium]
MSTPQGRLAQPWIQLAIGVVCMACVANLQYGWTLFVNPIDMKYHWGREAIQVAFTLFVLIETWLIPVEGYLVDRFGPRWVVLGGSVLVTCAWALNSVADSLPLLYVGAALGGIGTGCVYGTCVGNALKWFSSRRGLAAGITAAGFGAGAAITVVPISNMIKASGYEHAFMFFGLLQGAIVFLMAWGLVEAPHQAPGTAKAKVNQSARSYAPAEVLRNPVFWVLYVMFVLVASGGLMMAASVAPIAKDFRIDTVPVSILFLSGAALPLALSADRVLDGLGRPMFGWLSDQIGRENTMALAFCIGAGALFALSRVGSEPINFVILSALYFGVFGEIYSLFPATQGDTFGSRFAASNAGILYTAKGTAALMVPLAAYVAKHYGWSSVFTVAMCFNVVAAGLALFVLKPMRARHLAASRLPSESSVEEARPLAASNA